MKIKIIDLLNKIANDEQPPKKIMYGNEEYKTTKILMEDNEYYYNYINDDMDCLFPINTNILNDEVEILETTITYNQDNIENNKQDNKIEKLELDELGWLKDKNNSHVISIIDIVDKINEIIDYINGDKE